MGNELQSALDDVFSAIAEVAGILFTPPTGPAFSAWPTEEPREGAGRLLQSPDQVSWYETKQAPVFKAGQTLAGADGKFYTVSKRLQPDPFTGAFKFSILPGRATDS